MLLPTRKGFNHCLVPHENKPLLTAQHTVHGQYDGHFGEIYYKDLLHANIISIEILPELLHQLHIIQLDPLFGWLQ